MKNLIILAMSVLIIASSCSRESKVQDIVYERPLIMNSLSQEDPIIEQFSEYGTVTIATQSWIDENATYSGVPHGNLYLLDQLENGLVEIYVYDDIDEYPISMRTDYDKQWEEGMYLGVKYVTCAEDGNDCHEGSINGRCVLMQKPEEQFVD
jgi:hypothetical protein